MLAGLTLAADPRSWIEAGFRVEREPGGSGVSRIGRSSLRLAGPEAGRGIVGWSLQGMWAGDLDGLPTERADDQQPPDAPAPTHPNGAVALDHVVAFSPDLERTVAALEAAGLDFRRLREGPTPGGSSRQAFFRVGEVILEVVQHPAGTPAAQDMDAPSRFYGLAFQVDHMETAVEVLGDRLGAVRDAIQPGRRIATVRREAGLGLPVAFMTPNPASPRSR